jgi:PAS domain S-box-containing protein
VYIDVHAPDERLLLAQPNDFIGKHIRDVLPADVATSTERVLARLTPGEPPTVLEYTLQTADGERHREARLVISQDNQVLSVVRDVTERKRTQEALRQSQARYALATSVAGVGVWDWDLTTNEVYVDPSLKAILGYSDQEITNNADDWARLIHPDDLETAQARARDHLEGRSPFYEIEHRMLHRDGSIRWFMVRGSAVWLDGRAARIIGTSTDVTERKKSDQALLDAQADLARVSRLTALGEFAASIAHEIRQPLTAITTNAKACLHWLGGPKPDLSEVREALDDVVDASMRADELIRRNRELFKHQRIQKTLIDINAVIKESTRLATMQLQGSHVTLTTSLALDLPPVPADRVELQQVLLNLIANGIDAMDAVEPALRVLDVSSSQTADGFVKISVKDSGVGLSGVDRERMFSLSYTTKPSGTGVGLSVSRAIVEAHGGRLWAEQNAGLGATFYFTVPAQSTIAAA